MAKAGLLVTCGFFVMFDYPIQNDANQSAWDPPHVHFNSKSFKVYKRVAGLYNDLRWLADVSSQRFYPPKQVWYQFIDPGEMKGLVRIMSDPNLRTTVQKAEHRYTTPACHILSIRICQQRYSSVFPGFRHGYLLELG
ncbi:hypothetical protein RB195_003157 [Necator americanus]|uniref:Uncharacterized protein n=1 Tax=Necator americanus TaxID=51031 RepID=A0ABR1DNR7_NECAM